MSGKKLPGKPKLPKVSTFMVCKIQNIKVGTVSTAYPADSKKPFAMFAIMQS